MILTVTPNTALDHVYEVEHFVSGKRLRALSQAECIGGKGNLVSAFVVDLGGRSVSLGFAAGPNGQRLAELVRQRGAHADFSPAQGETRRIMVVVDHKRRGQTWLLPETLRVNRASERDLAQRVICWLPKAAWLALCGSLPPGCSPQLCRDLIELAHVKRVPVLIDSRGPALLHALQARPEVVKLNLEELRTTFPPSRAAGSAREKIAARLSQVLKYGVEFVVCTMGARGSVAATQETRWAFSPPRVKVRSSAGSGDVFTAALLVWRERGAAWPEALRWATAAGTAKATEARTDRLDLETTRQLSPRVRVAIL